MAFSSGDCHILGGYSACQLELVVVKIYTCATLMQLLGIGRDRAYRIMRGYGFRVGDRALRISEPQVAKYIKEQHDGRELYAELDPRDH